jgi:hypothetical protein
MDLSEEPMPRPGKLEADYLSPPLNYSGCFPQCFFNIRDVSKGKGDGGAIESVVWEGEAL